MDINEIKAGSVMNALVAEALGWQAFKEKRGEYEFCVSIAPGEKMPWERRQKPNPERYSKTSCTDAAEIGFFGTGFPDYSGNMAVAMEIPQKMRQLGKDLEFCRELAYFLTIAYEMVEPEQVLWNAFYGLDKLEVLFCLAALKTLGV